ncbi:MAG: hypothetical protein WAU42_08870 [Solirubrobacteraceae bacterium]
MRRRSGCADPRLVAEHEDEQKRTRDKQAEEAEREIVFDEIAEAWLAHRISVVGIKRTTRNDYETMLLRPGDRPKKRGRTPRARLMAKFGGRSAASITTREIARWLHELDRDPELSARSVKQAPDGAQQHLLLCLPRRHVWACRQSGGEDGEAPRS